MRLRERCDCYGLESSRLLSRDDSKLFILGGFGRQLERDCFHGEVTVRRVFRSTGRLLLENAMGYVRAYDLSEVYAN